MLHHPGDRLVWRENPTIPRHRLVDFRLGKHAFQRKPSLKRLPL